MLEIKHYQKIRRMYMKKKFFVCLLSVLLLLVFYGCSIVPDPTVATQRPTTTDTISTTAVPETTEETLPWMPRNGSNYKNPNISTMVNPNHDYEITRQVLPEIVDNSDGLPILKWVCLVKAGYQVWNEAAVVELNQMLADRNLPYRVQFTILSASGYPMPWDWFTNPEIQKELADADLIYGCYTAKDMEQWLLPVTDHIYGNSQHTLSGALPNLLSWFSMEANGEIYGIPQQVSVGNRQGWCVDPDFMEKFGLTADDFNRDFWEMDELFAEIYEKNGNQPFLKDDFSGKYGGMVLANSMMTSVPMNVAIDNSAYQGICMCFSIDLQAQKPTVVNMLETELFSNVQSAALRYLKAEYMTKKDYAIRYTKNITASEPYLDKLQKCYIIPCTPMGLRCVNYPNMTGIHAKSAHSEEALSLLEQIITDDALRLHLCYGKEGRDYTLVDGVYTLITQKDGSCYYMDYLSPQAHFFNFTNADEELAIRIPSTTDLSIVKFEGMSRLESYQAHLAQASFSYCPVVFDYSDLEDELAALDEVLNAYYPMFSNTEHYSEEYYQEMLQKMEEAGMSTVITELQRQLDAWIAEHPNWDPLS